VKLSALFDPEPGTWGLRGDPHLWRAMREHLAEGDLPATLGQVRARLHAAFAELAGVDLADEAESRVYRERYAHGGMSSGWISVDHWRETLMPLLARRARAVLREAGGVEGERVWLTPLAVSDAEEMTAVLSGGELYAFTGGRPPTQDELRARYARQVAGRSADGLEEWRNWIIRRDEDGQAVGYVQATIADAGKRAEIAWVIGLDWQGQGHARDAARALVAWLDARGVATVQAHIHPDHAASAAVARSAGLQPTGQIEDAEQLWSASRSGRLA